MSVRKQMPKSVTYKYRVGQTVVLEDGRTGKIKDYQVSIIDNKAIPSYWILFSKKVFSDGYPRNIWESSIISTKVKHFIEFISMNKDQAERIAKFWGELKTKWNKKEIELDVVQLIEIQKGINNFFPQFNYYLDKHS